MKYSKLKLGDIVQICPSTCVNPAFGGCMLIVTEVYQWGVVGYVSVVGDREKLGGVAYYRATWAEIAPTGGIAQWVVKNEAEVI
jgi:hypothetical protein